MFNALKQLGFDDITDVNFAADVTILEEGNELLSRIQDHLDGKEVALPLITSCSPGWIRYIEQYYPEYLPNLSSCKSPQQMQGALTKHYYADKIGVAKEKMHVTSIMPCIAKKYEAQRPEMEVDGIRDVDNVLTTRELARLIKRAGIDFANLEDYKPTSPLAEYTGAGVIFGTTGGVMEAALRTVADILDPKAEIDLSVVRGVENGIKEATIKLAGLDINIAVVHGAVNIPEMFERIAKGDKQYHFIEVMACTGGCINGGGQPVINADVQEKVDFRQKRAGALYLLDSTAKMQKSHKNPAVNQLYEEYIYVNDVWEKLGTQTINLESIDFTDVSISNEAGVSYSQELSSTEYTETTYDEDGNEVTNTKTSTTLVIGRAGADDGTEENWCNNVSIGNGDVIPCTSAGLFGSKGYAYAVARAGGSVKDANGEEVRVVDYSTTAEFNSETGKYDGTEYYVTTGQTSGFNAFAFANGSVIGNYGIAGGRGCFSTAGKGIDPSYSKFTATFGYECVANRPDDVLIGTRNYAFDYKGAYSLGSCNLFESTNVVDGTIKPYSNGWLIGYNNKATADSLVGIGIYNQNLNENTFTFGRRLNTGANKQMLLGWGARQDARVLFAIGDAHTDAANVHSAFYMLRDYKSGQEMPDGQASHAYLTCGLGIGYSGGTVGAGAQSILVGKGSVSSNFSIVTGVENTVSHNNCLIAGKGLTSSREGQTLLGNYAKVDSRYLFAIGNGASASARDNVFEIHHNNRSYLQSCLSVGPYSTNGFGSDASPVGRFMAGTGLTGARDNQTKIGQYDANVKNSLFVIGCGTSSARKDAFRVNCNNDGTGTNIQINLPQYCDEQITMNKAPTAAKHLVTKEYVDNVSSSLKTLNDIVYANNQHIIDGTTKVKNAGHADLAGYISNAGSIKISDFTVSYTGSLGSYGEIWKGYTNITIPSAINSQFTYMVLLNGQDSDEMFDKFCLSIIIRPDVQSVSGVFYTEDNDGVLLPWYYKLDQVSSTQFKLTVYATTNYAFQTIEFTNGFLTPICLSSF